MESMRKAQKAIRVLMNKKLDSFGTKRSQLEALAGSDAVQSAFEAGYLIDPSPVQNGKWVAVSDKGFIAWDEIRPKARLRPHKFKPCVESERALVHGEVAVSLLSRARPGQTSFEVRQILREIAAEHLDQFNLAARNEGYEARWDAVNDALLNLL